MKALVWLSALALVGCEKADHRAFARLCSEGKPVSKAAAFDAAAESMRLYAALEMSKDYWIGEDDLIPEALEQAGVQSAWSDFAGTPAAVCVELGATVVGRECTFMGGKRLRLLDAKYRVKLVEAKTAKVLAEDSFTEEAGECPQLAVMSNNEQISDRTPPGRQLQPRVAAFLAAHLPEPMRVKARAALAAPAAPSAP